MYSWGFVNHNLTISLIYWYCLWNLVLIEMFITWF
jgi:hypothetical protein